MATENEPAKLLLPYLQRADELQKHEPLVAYYCRLYAMERGLRIPQSDRTKTTNALLVSLMKQLEKDKKSLKLGPDDNLHLEGFASSVFAKADKQDRAGRADLNTAKTFYAASIFLEILNQFGELQPDLEQKQKYAAWKAANIRKALKEGRNPLPGPPEEEKDPSFPSRSGEFELEPTGSYSASMPDPSWTTADPTARTQAYDEDTNLQQPTIFSQRWQPEEDAFLRAYVKQYGPKEWNLISQRTGKPLARDPKSCLERWKNYLKPGIKKGSLTPEEQNLVISLQSKYGNKWKKIAAEVPGRTAKRLGKWWEVFKEKQLKQLEKSQKNFLEYGAPPGVSAVAGGESPEKAVQGRYDHILETFAEKYVQPKLFALQTPTSMIMPAANLPLPEPPPVLSLGSVPILEPVSAACTSGSGFPAWMNMNMTATPTSTSSLTSSSSTPSPCVSLTLSPSQPPVLDPVHADPSRFFPIQQVCILIQHCKELEEGRENWIRHKKEATWRLNRLEQQLESEKARRRKEKMDEIKEKIRRLREEEMAFVSRMEVEYREELNALRRDAEAKEARLMEAWCSNHVKLTKLIEQIGDHTTPMVTADHPLPK